MKTASPRPRILIVEDEIIIARELEQIIQQLGYLVVGIDEKGENAIQSTEKGQPDLVLMDIRLQGAMDGITAAEAITTQFGIPVVFLTAFADDSQLEKAKLVHPYGYLTKPVHEKSLKAAIDIALHVSKIDADRKQLLKNLQASENRFKLSFESSAVGMALLDHHGKFISVNQAICEITGYSSFELLTMTLEDITHPEEIERSRQRFEGSLVDCKPYRMEKRYLTKNGETKFGIETMSPVPDAEGHHHLFIAHFQDITSQKETEEQLISLKEKEILIQEVHHRVKNNLQVISSLIGMQILRSENNQFVEILNEFQNRIKAMSLVHEQIYRSDDLSKIELDTYIRNLISSLMQASDQNPHTLKLHYDLEPLSTDLKKSICIGLIVTELFTNAVKHAFKGINAPEILISLSREGNSTTIIFHDNGVGFPEGLSFSETNTLGLKIVKMFTDQLKGDVKVVGEAGTKFVVSFDNPVISPDT